MNDPPKQKTVSAEYGILASSQYLDGEAMLCQLILTRAAHIDQSSHPNALCLILVYIRSGKTMADMATSMIIVAATLGALSSKMMFDILADHQSSDQQGQA